MFVRLCVVSVYHVNSHYLKSTLVQICPVILLSDQERPDGLIMDDTVLTTRDVNQFVQGDPVLRSLYQGTFARDEFSSEILSEQDQAVQSEFPKAYIVNTDPSDRPGKHWVCLYRPSPGIVQYFDSYGLDPSHQHPDFQAAMAVSGWRLQRWNLHPVQAWFSSMCGVYCLYVLAHRARGWTLEEVMGRFDPNNTPANEGKVWHWFCTHPPPPPSSPLPWGQSCQRARPYYPDGEPV